MRPSKDQTLMDVAHVMAKRGTCSRLQVGCVIAKDTRVVSSAWNGTLPGQEHCTHTPGDGSCQAASHAEENAILYAARAGVSTLSATLYCTHSPCLRCARMIVQAGIQRVFWGNWYGGTDGADLLNDAGVQTYVPITVSSVRQFIEPAKESSDTPLIPNPR